MKVIVVTDYGTTDVVKYMEVEKPVLKLDRVLIRVEATSVNFADVKARYANRGRGSKPPFIPGLDAAGVIEQVGENVRGLQVGQRVIAFPHDGSYAEYVAADESLTFHIPDDLSFDIAAAAPIVSFTAYKLLADVILDSISGVVSERSLECLAKYGRLVHFGNSSGDVGQFSTIDLHASCRSVLGFSLGTTRKERPHLLQSAASNVLRYLADGRLDIRIGHRFNLDQAADAHRLVESRMSTGKVLLGVRG